jgi:hypothetical protein
MAHNLCSATFISGLDAEATADELVKPMLPGFVGPLLRYHVDPTLKTVQASVAGFKPMRAAFTAGYGCRLVLGPLYSGPVPAIRRAASPADSFAPPTQVVAEDSDINAALDREFTEQPARGQRIYIIPSEQLIVARFGYSPGPDFGIVEDLALIKAAITALRSH